MNIPIYLRSRPELVVHDDPPGPLPCPDDAGAVDEDGQVLRILVFFAPEEEPSLSVVL